MARAGATTPNEAQGTGGFLARWAPALEASPRVAFLFDGALGVPRWCNAAARARHGDAPRLDALLPRADARAALRATIAAGGTWEGELADGTRVVAIGVPKEGRGAPDVFVEAVGPVSEEVAALVARLAAAEAEVSRLRRAAHRRDAEHAVAMAVGQGLDPTEIARLVVRSIARLVPAREARVALLEAEELRPLVALRDLPARHPVAASPAALARLRRAPVQRVAAEAAVEYPALRAVEGGRSVLFAPIDADELVLGFVEIHADRPFSPDEVELAAVLAGMLGTALVRARVIERARRDLDAREASAVLDQDALDHANDQLLQAAKLASIGELSAGLVHELNQPLNVLGGYVELLREGALGEPARARALDVMQRAVARMTSLVDNLRTFVRGGAPVVEPVEVARVVLLARELTVGALKRGVQVDAEPGLVVLGDATRLGQVVVNLLANALQAGGDPVAVSVYAEAGDRVVIEVTDRGPGVPEALRGRIFEPFFTTKPAGRGTGLGLSVSARIARELGGRIEVDENPGGGARFRVSLPAWRPDGGVVS